jgi:extracellular factor (EF) 3-hydroxypalmitic acid methyl ester biosynthesis protein
MKSAMKSQPKLTSVRVDRNATGAVQPPISKKDKLVRQDRFPVVSYNCVLKTEKEEFKVLNYSTFGLAIFSHERMPEDTVFVNAVLIMENFEIAHLDLQLVRHEALSEGGYLVAFESIASPINTEILATFPEVWRVLTKSQDEEKYSHKLPELFRLKVLELKNRLKYYEESVENIRKSQNFLSRNQLEDFENMVIHVMAQSIYNDICTTNKYFEESLKSSGAEVVKWAFEYYRKQLSSLVYQSPFATRSLEKPLGYPGDYEMMNLIYRNESMALTLFGRCMEKAFQLHPEPQAVRNRAVYLANHITKYVKEHKGEQLKVLSVASGPAFEIKILIEEMGADDLERITFYLLDQDLASLKYAQKQLKALANKVDKKVNINLINVRIKDFLVEGIDHENFDIIYSAGLFDYFADAVARHAGALLTKYLATDGEMVIGNFAIETPNQFGMRLVFDWSLVYRSRKDLELVFAFPDYSTNVEMEPNGINLFCIVKKR